MPGDEPAVNDPLEPAFEPRPDAVKCCQPIDCR
jgi:hypothetical protein